MTFGILNLRLRSFGLSMERQNVKHGSHITSILQHCAILAIPY